MRMVGLSSPKITRENEAGSPDRLVQVSVTFSPGNQGVEGVDISIAFVTVAPRRTRRLSVS